METETDREDAPVRERPLARECSLPREVPLSREEEAVWESLVEEGLEILAPKREAEAAKRAENRAKLEASRDYKIRFKKNWKPKERGLISESLKTIPASVKRYVVGRAAGLSFHAALSSAGVSWAVIEDAKRRSEEMRAALTAQYERSRDLMKAKAFSVVEQSQDEGAQPNFAQMQMAGKVLAALDRAHFGEDRGGSRREDDAPKQLGGGGFVINVIGDAAAVAAKPVSLANKALVFTDV